MVLLVSPQQRLFLSKGLFFLFILSIIYFYVLWVFCLHVCARSPGTGVIDSCDLSCGCWESSLVLWKSSQRALNSWATSPAPPHILWNGLVLVLWVKPSYRALPACRLRFCWFPVQLAGPGHSRWLCELLPLLLPALCLAFKTFWVVCFFF